MRSSVVWKNLSETVEVTHFSSQTRTNQIYLKKVKALNTKDNFKTIFLFHDLASHHGRFTHLVDWFRAQHPDVSFVLMDFAGHGLSSGTRGHIEHFNDLVDDLAHVFSLLNKTENEEWIALGHGVGALGLLELANRFDDKLNLKIDKFILSNFVLNFSSLILNIQDKLIENATALKGLMKSTRPVEIYLPDQILSDSNEQRRYIDDPLIVRRPTYHSLQCINTKVRSLYQDAYFLDKPTLLLKSSSPYLFTNGMDSFSKGFKKDLLTEKKYSNLKHDLYNERDNLVVFNDIAQWIF